MKTELIEELARCSFLQGYASALAAMQYLNGGSELTAEVKALLIGIESEVGER